MSKIVEADINTIASNPFRRLHTYPYIESKLTSLKHSIQEVGLWPSIIARPFEERLWRYEIAFGHHRLEACKRLKLKTVPLIIEALSDKEMLQYMGRENLEDYNASFLIQLESWEAAIKSGLVGARAPKQHQPLDIAMILGWTRDSDTSRLNSTAEACNAAYALIVGGHLSRDDFRDLTVYDARQIAGAALTRIQQAEKLAAHNKRPRQEIETFKRHVGRGAADTAEEVRKGKVAQRDVRAHVDYRASVHSRKTPSPLFAVFANAIADNLRRTLATDSDANRLSEIEKSLDQISMIEDWEALRRLDVELQNLSIRSEAWQKRLIPSKDKIKQFKLLEKKES